MRLDLLDPLAAPASFPPRERWRGRPSERTKSADDPITTMASGTRNTAARSVAVSWNTAGPVLHRNL